MIPFSQSVDAAGFGWFSATHKEYIGCISSELTEFAERLSRFMQPAIHDRPL
ncbi:MAG: hypothetical protein N2C14_23145 [Planctomycetales bacterium]